MTEPAENTSKPVGRCAITTWNNLTDTAGTSIDTTWDEFFASMRTAPPYRGDVRHGGWSAAVCEPCARADVNVCGLSALVLDYDGGTSVDDAVAHWSDWYGLLYTTRRHKSEAPRFRIILPFTRIVTPDEYAIVWKWAEQLANDAGHKIDAVCHNPSRYWYLPGVPRGGEYVTRDLRGAALDPDPILAAHRSAPPPSPAANDYAPSSVTGDDRRTVAYLNAALRRACSDIANAPEGTRNQTLNAAAYGIARLVAGGELDRDTAWTELRRAAERAGLASSEIDKTLGSAFGAAANDPKKIPPPRERPALRAIRGGLGGTGTDGPAPDPEPTPGPRRIFKLGDHVELAEATLSELETSPMTFDDGEFWRYDPADGLWKKLDRSLVQHTVKNFSGCWIEAGDKFKPVMISAGTCKGVADMIHDTIVSRVDRPLFRNAKPGIAFRNVFVTVEGGIISTRPHAPEHLARSGLPFDYDPLDHPQLDRFFADLFEGCADANDRVKLLQEFVGACLLGMATSYQRCLVLFGTGNNGKSQVQEICKAAFPEGTFVALSPYDWKERFRLSLLVGALANFVGELPNREMANNEIFKGVVVGDEQTAELKHRDSFKFTPVTGHMFAANALPRSDDLSTGFFRRFMVLPLTKVFPESGVGVERDIGKKIAVEERQAIAAWAVEGAARLQRQGGYTVPSSAQEVKDEWATETDSVKLFLRERTESSSVTRGEGLRFDDLYAAYKDWAKNLGFTPCNGTTFAKRYATSGCVRKTINGRARYFVQLLGREAS